MHDRTPSSQPLASIVNDEANVDLAELLQPVIQRWRLLAAASIAAGIVGFAIASVLPKWYTAQTVLLAPQQQQSAAAAAVSQLGALGGLAGSLGQLKSPADQYVALMQSVTVRDQLIDRFKLMDVYEADLRVDARERLAGSVRISAGKKDGLITIQVDDRDPQRAADIANAHVDALKQMATHLAVTEAQQRRIFFEQQMLAAKERLTQAQAALASAGLGEGLLKAEPKSAAEGYARVRAEATAAEVKLQTLRRSLADGTPEVRRQEALLGALREQVRRAEAKEQGQGGTEYISRYRNFKYEETLFDIFSKQYELARVDESREGALIQVVDRATAPERKAGPKRLPIASMASALTLLLLSGLLVWRQLRIDRTAVERR